MASKELRPLDDGSDDDDSSTSTSTTESSENLTQTPTVSRKITNSTALGDDDTDSDDDDSPDAEQESQESIERESQESDGQESLGPTEAKDEATTPDVPEPPLLKEKVKGGPPKMRIKLSLKMATSKTEKAPVPARAPSPGAKDQKGDSAANKGSTTKKKTPPKKKKVVKKKTTDSASSKKSEGKGAPQSQSSRGLAGNNSASGTAPPSLSAGPSTLGRPVRLPPIASPGLLMVPPPHLGPNCDGYTTPGLVFDHAMGLAGYTTENRTTHPHRGSSMKRQVGDMFDTDVMSSSNFPRHNLEPSHFLQQNGSNQSASESDTKSSASNLPGMVIDVLSKMVKNESMNNQNSEDPDSTSKAESNGGVAIVGMKRRRKTVFLDMVPTSVSTPYPAEYVEKRIKYIEQVEARERAIIASQEARAAAEEANAIYEEAKEEWMQKVESSQNADLPMPVPPPIPAPVHVPPIPVPPIPPDTKTEEASTSAKDKKHLVAHLDPECFLNIIGRYHGLSSNGIADPQFVGPNAPGIAGLNTSGGSGLATSYGGSSGGGASFGSVGNLNLNAGGSNGGMGQKTSGGAASSGGKKSKQSGSGGGACGGSSKKTSSAPTSSSLELKRLMEQGGDMSEKMRIGIIRAAVYASRSGSHGGSFVGANGETYPDVSKAFANYAGLRPCNRCKSNKQGAYHCRLRRKHKDIDYDGGNSPAVLAPLFEEPLESLLAT